MRRRIRERLTSPAIVVAVLGLVAALAGTAVAGQSATTSAISKKKVKKIAKKQINKLAPGLHVASAETANTASEATRATNADLLDGIDSASLLRGRGRTFAVHGADAPSGAPSAPIPLQIGGNLTLDCNNPASAGSSFTFTNTARTADVWTEKVQDGFSIGHPIFYQVVPNGGTASMDISGPVVSSGRGVAMLTISRGNRLTRIEARIVFTAATRCSFNALITELSG
jgi:hypothetical protein